jgi:ABC-type antimicrobial peptide transport system permease subunit
MVNGAPRVVLINETMARQLFGGADAIGKRVSGWAEGDVPVWREIVGIVGDVRAFGRESEIPPEIYLPYTQPPDGAWNAFNRTMTVMVRTRPGADIAPAMRQALRSVDPLVPGWDLQPMSRALEQSTASRRFNTLLLTLLGATGLLLATIGIYGLIAFLVSQRRHEIGVRMVLGATTRDIARMIVRQSATLALIGVGIGALVSFWATKSLRNLLFEVQSSDPIAYVAAGAVLVAAALVASLVPARRAARVEPVRSINAG